MSISDLSLSACVWLSITEVETKCCNVAGDRNLLFCYVIRCSR